MNGEGRRAGAFLSAVPSCTVDRKHSSGPVPSSFDIRCSIFCGSILLLPTTAADRPIPHCYPLYCYPHSTFDIPAAGEDFVSCRLQFAGSSITMRTPEVGFQAMFVFRDSRANSCCLIRVSVVGNLNI